MILRKPFAFLIKRFKLIHLILSIFIIYLLVKTNNMLSFYIDYINNGQSSIGTNIANELFNSTLIISIILILVGNFIVAYLMKFKEKPIVFYAFNIIVYIGLSIIYYYTFTVIKSLEIGLVDIRTLKLVQDLLTMVFIFQWLSIITMLIRSFGFDVKKFDFKKDLEELEIKDNDNEEFEVDVQFDSDRFKRNFNKTLRHLKYAYLENKFVIRIVLLIATIIIGIFIYLRFNVYDNSFKQGQYFSDGSFNMNVKNSYVTDSDNNNNVISDNNSYVIINLNIRAFNNKGIKFQSSNMALEIKSHKFYHKKTYKNLFEELGTFYINQKIYNNETNYILIYKIPYGYRNENMVLKYFNGNSEMKIIIKPNKFNNEKSFNYNLNDIIKFDESILKDTKLQITSSECNSKFKIEYKHCVSTNECYDSYEYLRADYTGNGNKSLLKIDGNISWGNNNINPTTNLYDFIKIYGNILYTVNGKEQSMNIPINEIKTTKIKTNEIYIEVPKEVENADNIYLIFKVRDKTYKYIVK